MYRMQSGLETWVVLVLASLFLSVAAGPLWAQTVSLQFLEQPYDARMIRKMAHFDVRGLESENASAFCQERMIEPAWLDHCRVVLALKLGDISICDQIGSDRLHDLCIVDAARDMTPTQHMGASGYCDFLHDPFNLPDCRLYVANVAFPGFPNIEKEVVDFCGWIEEPAQRDICVLRQAYYRRDAQRCEQLSGAAQSQGMKDVCIGQIAVRDEFEQTCGLISNQATRSACVRAVQAVRQKDAALCRGMSEPFFRDQCLFKLAAYRQEKEDCDAVLDPAIREECRFESIVGSNDLAACGVFPRISRQAECVAAIAIRRGDAGLCAGILPAFMQARCVYALAMINHDAAFCEGIRHEYYRKSCLKRVLTVTPPPDAPDPAESPAADIQPRAAYVTDGVYEWAGTYLSYDGTYTIQRRLSAQVSHAMAVVQVENAQAKEGLSLSVILRATEYRYDPANPREVVLSGEGAGTVTGTARLPDGRQEPVTGSRWSLQSGDGGKTFVLQWDGNHGEWYGIGFPPGDHDWQHGVDVRRFGYPKTGIKR